jgi:hypothetical protein
MIKPVHKVHSNKSVFAIWSNKRAAFYIDINTISWPDVILENHK